MNEFYYMFQRLLRILDGLNFKEFVAFLSAFSSRASLQQKIECNCLFAQHSCLESKYHILFLFF